MACALHTHTHKNILICYAFLYQCLNHAHNFFKKLPGVSRPMSGSRMLSRFSLSFQSLSNRGIHALINTHAVCIYKCCTRQAGHFIIADSELLLPDRNGLDLSHKNISNCMQVLFRNTLFAQNVLKLLGILITRTSLIAP